MRRVLITAVALSFIATTAMAQSNAAIAGRSSYKIQQLSPLKVDSNIVPYSTSKPNILPTPQINLQDKKAAENQSILIHHVDSGEMPDLHRKMTYENSDSNKGLESLRDYIVRKRRDREGRPLQPLPPVMR